MCSQWIADGGRGYDYVGIGFVPFFEKQGVTCEALDDLLINIPLHRRRGSSETLGTRPGIHVIPSTGQLVAFAETPEDTITNCTFGGPDLRTLYITCGKLLLSLRTRIPGKGKVGGT